MRALVMVVAAVICGGCASTVSTPQPFPRPGSEGPTVPGSEGPTVPGSEGPGVPGSMRSGGYEISGTALGMRGIPYRNGGADPNGFDCSGLVWYVFAHHGIAVPRTVEDQFKAGGSVAPADLRPGDLVFFSTTASGATHVGISVGGESFVHAPSSSGVVRVEDLRASYWAARFLGARRIGT